MTSLFEANPAVEVPHCPGEETACIIRQYSADTKVVFVTMLSADRPVNEIASAAGRDPLDVLTFASRCAPKV